MTGEISTPSKKKNVADGPKKSNKPKKKVMSGNTKVPPPILPGEPGSGQKKSTAVGELKQLFVEMDLPDKIIPNNVKTYKYNRSSGELDVQLQSGFEKAFDKDNIIKFDNHIKGRLKSGVFDRIKGITRGSASIVSMKRGKPGFVEITGKLGFFSKTLTFADESLPDLP